MYYCQLIWSICDYSFSDTEVYTFQMSKDKEENFIHSYNKSIKETKDIFKVIERSRGILLSNSFGFINLNQSDTGHLTIVELSDSKNGVFLINESFNSFTDNNEKESIVKIEKNFRKEDIIFFVNKFNKKLDELNKDKQTKLKSYMDANKTNDVSKEVQKSLKSLKGKNKKNIEELEADLFVKISKKHRDRINKLRDLFVEKEKEFVSLINNGFVEFLLKNTSAKKIEIEMIYESFDESGLIHL